MPKGKKGGGGGAGRGKGGKQDKSAQKQREKVVQDKTFGLKNKNKSKRVQTYVSQQMQQAKQGGQRKKREEEAPKSKKQLQAEKQAEFNAIFKPVVDAGPQKLAPGVDPKSVLCTFFKKGMCKKGNKCKFSHDMSIERKSEKVNLYEDRRDKEAGMLKRAFCLP